MAARINKAVEVRHESGAKQVLLYQTAWFLQELQEAGERGITKADYPGLHVGDIVMRLRRRGIQITCVMEPNNGAFGGDHGRYTLMSKITLKEVPIPKKTKPATAATVLASNSNTMTSGQGGLNGQTI